jgi:hypothetical protein
VVLSARQASDLVLEIIGAPKTRERHFVILLDRVRQSPVVIAFTEGGGDTQDRPRPSIGIDESVACTIASKVHMMGKTYSNGIVYQV